MNEQKEIIMTDEVKKKFEGLVEFFKEEELDPELAKYMTTNAPFGCSIQHPLVYSIMHHDLQNHMVNKSLAYKKEALKEAVKAKKWNTVVFLHERPWRLDAFMTYAHLMTATEYWQLLGAIWID